MHTETQVAEAGLLLRLDIQRKLEAAGEGGEVIRREDYPYAVFAACWLLFVVLFIAVVLWNVVFASPSQSDTISKKYGIEPALLKAVCETESNWRAHAIGDDGKSIGLCQINPETALRMFPKDWYGNLPYKRRVTEMRKLLLDPEANMHIAAVYLKHLMVKYDDVTLVLMAWNAGEWFVDSRYECRKQYTRTVFCFVGKVRRKMVENHAP